MMAQLYDRRPVSKQAPAEEQHSLRSTQPYSYAAKPADSQQQRWPPSERVYSPRLKHEASPQQSSSAQDPGAMYQSRPIFSQKPVGPQLPSLSSLFGGAPSHSPSPPYLESPREIRHDATPAYSERSCNASYFQRPTISQHSSYNATSEQIERSSFQPPPRPSQTPGGLVSPRYEPRYRALESSRIHMSGSGRSWSPQSHAVSQEYASRDTSSSFKSFPDEARPLQPPVHRHEASGNQPYIDGPNSNSARTNYPPTPASTISGDPAAKEALGPKIWTGTQFLPRFVRQAEVPGEGMCFFYDDGTHCKTVIDGEIVNAHWGVTKAGKPRKRLAIACITCREKKIKCDPDFPRCVQCEKFGRICKFKNAPRGGQGSPETPPTEPEENLPRPLSSRTDGEPFKLENSELPLLSSPRDKHRPTTPDLELHPAKRQRNDLNHFTPVASEASPRTSILEGPPTWSGPMMGSTGPHNLLHEWQINPYTTHSGLVTELFNIFFQNVPVALYQLFPERVFRLWALSTGEKSLDELMLIYSILTLATIFSPKPEHKPLGAHYACVVRYACENRKFSIHLVQARILMSIYYYSINNVNDAWDIFGAAIRAAAALNLNLEIEKTSEANLVNFPYGLSALGYAECRRRTFWYCFLIDRWNGICSGQVCFINQEDIFLRLPSDTESFESQAHVVNPIYDPTTTPTETLTSKLGSLAYTISMTTIWGDITANIYRTSQRHATTGPDPKFTAFYEKYTRRLAEWEAALPARYRFNAANVERAVALGKAGAFLRIHSIFHTSCMILNRYVRPATLTAAQLAHHNAAAATHAEALLMIMDAVQARRIPRMNFTTPFVGYCIVTAVDIMSRRVRRGGVRQRLESFTGAKLILDDLARMWQHAQYQQGLVAGRMRELEELLPSAENEDIGRADEGEVVEVRERMEQIWPREMDCVYY